LVAVVTPPDYCEVWENSENVSLRRCAVLYRRCMGGTYRVVYVGEEESLELDVFKTARLLDRTLIGCEMAFKPECIEMVAKRGAGHPKVLPRV
jgi:hypothetical protein